MPVLGCVLCLCCAVCRVGLYWVVLCHARAELCFAVRHHHAHLSAHLTHSLSLPLTLQKEFDTYVDNTRQAEIERRDKESELTEALAEQAEELQRQVARVVTEQDNRKDLELKIERTKVKHERAMSVVRHQLPAIPPSLHPSLPCCTRQQPHPAPADTAQVPKLEAALNEEHARYVETSITADELRAELEERGRIIEGMTRELEALRKKEQGIAELSRLVGMAACCAALPVFAVLQLAQTLLSWHRQSDSERP